MFTQEPPHSQIASALPSKAATFSEPADTPETDPTGQESPAGQESERLAIASPNVEAIQARADRWNRTYPVGTRVRYWSHRDKNNRLHGTYIDTVTRSPAGWLGNQVVVQIVGRNGWHAVSHLEMIGGEA